MKTDSELWKRIQRLRMRGVSCAREDESTVSSLLVAVGDLTLWDMRRLLDLWEQDRQDRRVPLRSVDGG